MISDLLQNKTAIERSKIKGQEIAKLPQQARQNVKFSGADYDIEIVSYNAINRGIEIFARAWQPNGEQIGFGKDGSVDIERFVIINPPILVDDVNGNIVYEWTDNKGTHQRKMKEDAKMAILQSLVHTIKIKKEKFIDKKIINGKIGNTTTTVYPDADPETSTVDGFCSRSITSETYSTIRGGAGTNAFPTSNPTVIAYIYCSTTTDQFSDLGRGIALFDTSGIPDGDTISAATLSFYGTSATTQLSQTLNITSSNPSSNTNIATGDYALANYGSTKFATGIADSSWNTAGYNDFSFNASGIAAISKTGISKFGMRFESDIDNSAPTWASGQASDLRCYYAEQTGTSNDPKLVVEHGTAGPATLKTADTVAAASVKTRNGVAIASIKTWNTAA